MKNKIMRKRIVSLFLLISMMVSSTVTAYAASGDMGVPDKAEEEKQEQIDGLFEELNRIDAEKTYNRCVVKSAGLSENSAYAKSLEVREESYEVKEKEYEAELEKLGVHKIEPSNPEDMAILEAMR